MTILTLCIITTLIIMWVGALFLTSPNPTHRWVGRICLWVGLALSVFACVINTVIVVYCSGNP